MTAAAQDTRWQVPRRRDQFRLWNTGLVAGMLGMVLGSFLCSVAWSNDDPASALTDSQKLQLKQRDRLIVQSQQLHAQGKLGEAIVAAEAMLAIERRVLPPGHEDILGSLDWLARMYTEQENFAAARAARQEQLGILGKHYGDSHWKVTDARLALEEVDRQARMSREQRQKLAEAMRLSQESVSLYGSGKYAEALKLARCALGLRRDVLGERHPHYATSLNNLALLLELQGDYAAARPLHEQALATFKEILGERHPGYATSLNNLAGLLERQGDYAAARPLYEQALAIRREVLGQRHPDYAASLNNLAELLRAQGDYAAAKPLYEQALAILKEVQGERHPHYATSLDNLAGLLIAQKDYAAARPLLEKALAIRKEVQGERHPDYATSLDNLALLLGRLAEIYAQREEFAAARAAGQERLEILRKHYGASHWKVPDAWLALEEVDRQARMSREQRQKLAEATQLNQESVSLYRSGKYAEALRLARRALGLRRDVLGERHPDYATSLNNLAELLQAQGDYAAVRPFLEKALAICKEVQGEQHPHYASSLNNLAELLKAQGDYAAARPLYEQALAIRKEVLGERHPDYAQSLNNLALLLEAQGDYAAARPLLEQALAIRKEVLGERHPDYASNLNNLAELLQAQGDYAAARPFLEKALVIFKEVYGKRHPDYATILNNLAGLLVAQGDYAAAKLLYKQALAIYKEVQGEQHPDYANSLGNLAELLEDRGDYAAARPLYEQALAIRKQVLGERHPDYATSLNNLAVLLRAQGDYAAARPLHEQALVILKEVLGERHPDYARSLLGLSVLDYATRRPVEALARLGQCLDIEQESLLRVFSVSSEPAMFAYLDLSSARLPLLISMAASRDSPKPSAATVALNWTLRRKGIVLDTLCRFREAQRLAQTDPKVAERVLRLRGLKKRLNDLTLRPPNGVDHKALRQQLAIMREEIDKEETELNRLLSALHPEHNGGAGDVAVEHVRKKLPAGSALVEFLRVGVYDFQATGKASRWTPPRYFALVLKGGGDVAPHLIDLGLAEDIDADIDQFRQGLYQFGRARDGNKEPSERSEEEVLRETSRTLHRKLFAPLREALGAATLIYLSPDGNLNLLPFDALVDEQGKYLIESYRFAYLSSGRDLLRPAAPPARGTVVFADPDYNLGAAGRLDRARALVAKNSLDRRDGSTEGASTAPAGRVTVASNANRSLSLRGVSGGNLRDTSFTPLAHSREEAQDIERELTGSAYGPVDLYLGQDALEEVFKAMKAPRVLELSTHGFFLEKKPADPENEERVRPVNPGFGMGQGLGRLRVSDDPLLRSAVVLAGANRLGENPPGDASLDDGWLTAGEIAEMDLRGTELVVLSACESGVGDVKTGEGVQGLRRAFLHAGARTLVTSLFNVPDQETRELMNQFYRGLKGGQGKLASLHEAQLAVIRERRKNGGAAHPFFWAGFVLVGDPD